VYTAPMGIELTGLPTGPPLTLGPGTPDDAERREEEDDGPLPDPPPPPPQPPPPPSGREYVETHNHPVQIR
jgi:hypothetical protein